MADLAAYIRAIPLPHGMSLSQAPLERGFLLNVSDSLSVRYRCVYGYIGEIKFSPDDDSRLMTPETPAFLQIVVKLWWKYGNLPAEQHDSFAFCRLNAILSTEAFDGRTILRRVGDPVAGFSEAISGAQLSAQLTGWGPISAAEWQSRQPQSFPAFGGFELNGDAIAVLPKLGARNSPNTISQRPHYARL